MTQDKIAFTGRKGSGKDTCADMLPKSWQNIKFADPIKAMCRSFLRVQGLDEAMIERYTEGDLKETPSPYFNGKTARYFQQMSGTEFGRDLISESIWVDIAFRRAEQHKSVVITDARFENEEIALKERGYTLIRVVRPNLLDNEFSTHLSETYIDKMKVDHEIINDGTIEDLGIKFSKVLGRAHFMSASVSVFEAVA